MKGALSALAVLGLVTAAACGREDPALRKTRAYIEEMRAAGKLDTGRDGWRTDLPHFPELEFRQDRTYYWRLRTSHGEMRIRLMPRVAPDHVANFVYLSELGYFDGLTFHRVVPGFMVQGGCPAGNGTSGPGYTFEGEPNPEVRHDRRGLLSMANKGAPRTDGSQFFLTFAPTPWLDGRHTLFGEVVEGLGTFDALEMRGSPSGRPTQRLIIQEARVTVE